jgi:hypothetical protein
MYAGQEAGIKIAKIAKTHQLIHKHIDFSIAVGDVILGLVPQEKLPELLIERLGIERPDAMRITADVLDFLAPLEADTSKDIEATNSIPINSEHTDVAPISTNSLASEIAEAEAVMKNMQPIRTMSHDIEVIRAVDDEPTHSAASQKDLLDRTATIKDKNHAARWGTEQT